MARRPAVAPPHRQGPLSTKPMTETNFPKAPTGSSWGRIAGRRLGAEDNGVGNARRRQEQRIEGERQKIQTAVRSLFSNGADPGHPVPLHIVGNPSEH